MGEERQCIGRRSCETQCGGAASFAGRVEEAPQSQKGALVFDFCFPDSRFRISSVCGLCCAAAKRVCSMLHILSCAGDMQLRDIAPPPLLAKKWRQLCVDDKHTHKSKIKSTSSKQQPHPQLLLPCSFVRWPRHGGRSLCLPTCSFNLVKDCLSL